MKQTDLSSYQLPSSIVQLTTWFDVRKPDQVLNISIQTCYTDFRINNQESYAIPYIAFPYIIYSRGIELSFMVSKPLPTWNGGKTIYKRLKSHLEPINCSPRYRNVSIHNCDNNVINQSQNVWRRPCSPPLATVHPQMNLNVIIHLLINIRFIQNPFKITYSEVSCYITYANKLSFSQAINKNWRYICANESKKLNYTDAGYTFN